METHSAVVGNHLLIESFGMTYNIIINKNADSFSYISLLIKTQDK